MFCVKNSEFLSLSPETEFKWKKSLRLYLKLHKYDHLNQFPIRRGDKRMLKTTGMQLFKVVSLLWTEVSYLLKTGQ